MYLLPTNELAVEMIRGRGSGVYMVRELTSKTTKEHHGVLDFAESIAANWSTRSSITSRDADGDVLSRSESGDLTRGGDTLLL